MEKVKRKFIEALIALIFIIVFLTLDLFGMIDTINKEILITTMVGLVIIFATKVIETVSHYSFPD